MKGRLNYFRRILKVYLTRDKGYLSFWHERPAVGDFNPRELRGYYMTFADKAAYQGPKDERGVILFDYFFDIGRQYNPLAIAQYGLGNWNRYLLTRDQKYLEEAKKLGDAMIVGVNTDFSVKQNKGDKRPINDEKARIAVLAGLKSIDYVFLFNEKNPIKWISQIKPHVHVKAGDYKLSQIIEKGVVEKNGGKVVIAKMEKGYSTTKLINRILRLHKNQ